MSREEASTADDPRPEASEGAMSLLDHLDELRRRLWHSALALVLAFAVCWIWSKPLVALLLKPIREHLFEGGEIVFINLTEPFFIYMKAAGLAAVFVAFPFLLYQFWGFVAPGLYKHERKWLAPFLIFGTLFFLGGGWFAYEVALPMASGWLIRFGGDFKASITLRSAFQFESRILLGMGLVFEMPVLIVFLSRIGVVTPQFLLKYFRHAVLIIALLAAVITPTGDLPTMSVFAGPMILLYLLGIGLAWIFRKRDA